MCSQEAQLGFAGCLGLQTKCKLLAPTSEIKAEYRVNELRRLEEHMESNIGAMESNIDSQHGSYLLDL